AAGATAAGATAEGATAAGATATATAAAAAAASASAFALTFASNSAFLFASSFLSVPLLAPNQLLDLSITTFVFALYFSLKSRLISVICILLTLDWIISYTWIVILT